MTDAEAAAEYANHLTELAGGEFEVEWKFATENERRAAITRDYEALRFWTLRTQLCGQERQRRRGSR